MSNAMIELNAFEREIDAFEAWCEETDTNPRAADAWQNFEWALADREDEAAEAAAEARADLQDALDERWW